MGTTFKKGHIPHNKGKKGYGKWSKWYPKGELNPFFGKKHSPETIEKMRVAKLGKRKENTNNWQDSNSRRSAKYADWRKAVLQRYNNECYECGSTYKVFAHHIKPYDKYPELRLEVENGLALCNSCHSRLHNQLRKVGV